MTSAAWKEAKAIRASKRAHLTAALKPKQVPWEQALTIGYRLPVKTLGRLAQIK